MILFWKDFQFKRHLQAKITLKNAFFHLCKTKLVQAIHQWVSESTRAEIHVFSRMHSKPITLSGTMYLKQTDSTPFQLNSSSLAIRYLLTDSSVVVHCGCVLLGWFYMIQFKKKTNCEWMNTVDFKCVRDTTSPVHITRVLSFVRENRKNSLNGDTYSISFIVILAGW